MSSRPCSDTGSSPAVAQPSEDGSLVVAEGMPGAGKTTAVAYLAGAGFPVIGEYTTMMVAARRASPPAPPPVRIRRWWALRPAESGVSQPP